MRIRSVGARLSLALLLVVAGALGIVYLIVVPSLEHRLVNAKLAQLARAAPSLARQLPANRFQWPDFTDNASASSNARIVIFNYFSPPLTLQVFGDSHGGPNPSIDVQNDPLALEAALTFRPARGTVTRDDARLAEVAVPVNRKTILLLSASLHDSLGNVHLVQRRLLAAGGLALLVALLLGYGGARVFAGRLRRLERAAERIAGGRFDEPVVDEGGDEVGELARAFERMRQQLSQLENARREFIANASHELRTPLFSLGGFLELLDDEDVEPARRREFLATMQEQVERLTKLATDLLDLSRLDAGGLHVACEPVDLIALGEAVVRELSPVARQRSQVLEAVANGGVTAIADHERVLQVARSLVDNALRHTPEGAHVRICAVDGEDRAELSVEDDGGGIPPERAAHVFERFYRVEGAIASGSGLGLAIARELAELMGGELVLESSPGRTVFTLVLPTASTADPAPPGPVEA